MKKAKDLEPPAIKFMRFDSSRDIDEPINQNDLSRKMIGYFDKKVRNLFEEYKYENHIHEQENELYRMQTILSYNNAKDEE